MLSCGGCPFSIILVSGFVLRNSSCLTNFSSFVCFYKVFNLSNSTSHIELVVNVTVLNPEMIQARTIHGGKNKTNFVKSNKVNAAIVSLEYEICLGSSGKSHGYNTAIFIPNYQVLRYTCLHCRKVLSPICGAHKSK